MASSKEYRKKARSLIDEANDLERRNKSKDESFEDIMIGVVALVVFALVIASIVG